MDRDVAEYEAVPYRKTGGHKVRFRIALEASQWNDAVVECISLGQRVAHGWGISGSVLSDPGALSTSTSVAGVVMIAWELERVGSRSG